MVSHIVASLGSHTEQQATQIPDTPTPMARYPAKLSRNHRSQPHLRQQNQPKANNSNNKGKSKNNNRRPQHPVPSIDQQSYQSRPIPNRLAPSTNPVIRIKELSSLEDLLRQAGYKDTRICTPEADKTRKIKQTFEEEESEEINDLYGTFGLQRKESFPRPLEHRIQNITEPTIPFRSSSAMLRDLALQDIRLADKEVLSSSQQSESWWGGGMAALGRAAKAVIELSPPAKGPVVGDEALFSVERGSKSIARGESIRKIKSNIELGSATPPRSKSVPQEQRPVVTRTRTSVASTSPTKPSSSLSAAIGTPESIVTAFEQPPPFDDDAFGYGPLPGNYEQCDEDDTAFSHQNFEIASIGSSNSRQSSVGRQTIEEEFGVDDALAMFGSGSGQSQDLDATGKRVMADAVEYDDEFDTPPTHSIALPSVDTPELALLSGTHSDDIRDIEASPLDPLPIVDKPKKYADRATKLRIAKSTPLLKITPPESSWFASIRSVLSGVQPTYQALSTEQPSTDRAGALWISPTAIAAPTLVTTSTVMCDSASNAAVDLPPVISRPPSSGAVAAMSVRLRPSMARLRKAVGAPAQPKQDDAAPVLSPRLDWDEQGESYAGWGWSARKPKIPSREIVPATPPKGPLILKGSIDYTKSFFYKPMTPPQPGPSNPTRSADNQIRARRSIKSLRAALLLPVAAPPVPEIPSKFAKPVQEAASTPQSANLISKPPVLAIQSPGAWEAGRPPRQLILEGEEWDPRDGGLPGDWGKRAIKKGGPRKLKKKASKTAVA